MKSVMIIIGLLLVGLPQAVWAEGKKDQAAIVAGEITAFANHLTLRPQAAIDFTKVSGEYCFNMGLGKGGHMSHYSTMPTSTTEDVIDFVDARPLLKAGANFDGLPKLPGKLGMMKSTQWYFLSAGQFDPHHGKKFPLPMLVRATNLE